MAGVGEGSEEEVDPELEEIERAIRENEASAQAGVNGVAEAAPAAPPASPKHGRPRRAGRRPTRDPLPQDGDRVREAREAELRAKQVAEATSPKDPAVVPPKSLFEGNRDALTVWPIVLEETLKKGFTADQISIRIVRVPVGPIDLKSVRGQSIDLVPLIGSQVTGDSTISPAEALYSAILEYHLSYTGPAIYQLTFQYRFGGSGNIAGVPANVELRLDHPNVIRNQLEARDLRLRQASSGQVGGRPIPNPFPAGYPAPAGATPPAIAPNPSNPREAELLRQLAQENGFYRGLMEGRAEVAAVPTTPTPAATPARDPNAKPPGLTDEEWASIQRTRIMKDIGPAIAQAVTASLAGMGFTPEVVAGMRGAALQPVPVGPPPAPVTAMDALNEALKLIESATKFKEKLVGMMPDSGGGGDAAPKEEDDPLKMKPTGIGEMAYGPKLEDESWPDYLIRWGTHNPGAMQQIMAKAAQILDPQTIQKVVMAIAERGAKKGGGGGVGGAPAPAALQGGGEAPKKGWSPD